MYMNIDNEEIIERLKQWVLDAYNPEDCSFEKYKLAKNKYEAFDAGIANQNGWHAYALGKLLGMDLPSPKE